MTKQEEQKLREAIDSLLPMQDLARYLDELEKKNREIAHNGGVPRQNKM